MKTLFMLALLLLAVAPAHSQDVTAVPSGAVYTNTLTATLDTVDVVFRGDELGLDTYLVTMYRTSAGFDTVAFYALSGDGATWYKVLVTDMTAGGDSSQVVVGVTPHNYMFPQPAPNKFRFTTPDGVAATYFVIWGRRTFSSHY